MGYNDKAYKIYVEDLDTGNLITSGVTAFVYQAGTKTLATIYSGENRETLANPISRTQFAADDFINFYAAETSVDIYINDDQGNEKWVYGVTPTNLKTIQLDRASSLKHLVIPFGASDDTEVDTGIDLPKDCWLYEAGVEVVTTDATETIDVGLLSSETNGDANGILAAVSVANSGFVKPVAVTTGGSETYVSTTSYGALMGVGIVGTNTDGNFGLAGGTGHVVTGANATSVTYTGSAGSDTAAGYIHLWFKLIR